DWAVPVFPRDDDQGLRRVPRRIQLSADPEHSKKHDEKLSLARVVAAKWCAGRQTCSMDDGADDEVYVPYGVKAPGRFHVLDLFRCSGKGRIETGGPLWEEFRELVKDQI